MLDTWANLMASLFLMCYLMLQWQMNTKRLEQDLVVDGLVLEVVQNSRYL